MTLVRVGHHADASKAIGTIEYTARWILIQSPLESLELYLKT